MLKRHLKNYRANRLGWIGKIKTRQRLAAVYRSALTGLRRQGIEPAAQKNLSEKMIQTCFWDPKNILKYLEWNFFRSHEN